VRHATRITADSVPELIAKLDGGDKLRLAQTSEAFNAAVDRSVRYNPAVLDGRRTNGLAVDKTNWAMPLETGPFYAYPVTCGITFTFGGLKGNTDGQALNENGEVIEGLYVCGEMLGGLFSANYPGGSGLAAGVVFGRRAGNLA
jgi:tricarballylate dehydrogenase